MQLTIESEEAYRLAADLSQLTGESMTKAVTEALREKLEREKRARGREGMAEKLVELGRRFRELPVLDPRSPQEIMDDLYDEDGLPR